MDELLEIAQKFQLPGVISKISKHGSGNINHTFIGECRSGNAVSNFVLQRINNEVFKNPALVVRNMQAVTEHLAKRLESDSEKYLNWQVPYLFKTETGDNCWLEPDGSCWRAMSLIVNSVSYDFVANSEHAREVGIGLGTFHELINDLPENTLISNLRSLHVTPAYFEHYSEVKDNKKTTSAEIEYCKSIIECRKFNLDILQKAKDGMEISVCPIHGDPKVNNIMIDSRTGCAVSMIDLDTVQSAPLLYDIGDCLRSACNRLGEESVEFEKVSFDLDLFRAILAGYFFKAGDMMRQGDLDYIFSAVRLISFELGLRFFTDFLENNIYFRTDFTEHNLNRAIVQFKLTESIERQEKQINKIIKIVSGENQ